MTINNLGSGKAQNRSHIKILKRCSDIFVPFLTASIKETLNSANLPDDLKLADITPIHKKPIASCLCYLKILIELSMTSFPASLMIYSRKKSLVLSSSLLPLNNIWKLAKDQKNRPWSSTIDLSKAFNYMPNNLLIAKLDGCLWSWFHYYTSNRKLCEEQKEKN